MWLALCPPLVPLLSCPTRGSHRQTLPLPCLAGVGGGELGGEGRESGH